MNQVNQLEEIKAMGQAGALSTKEMHAALHAPLFIWRAKENLHPSPEAAEFIRSNILDDNTYEFLHMPFPWFRMWDPGDPATWTLIGDSTSTGVVVVDPVSAS